MTKSACRIVALAGIIVAAGCVSAPGRTADDPDKDPRITAFVTYMAAKGIQLYHGEGRKEAGKWRLRGSASDPYTFVAYIRAFRVSETDKEMDAEASQIQLHYRLNHAAHLGISLAISPKTGTKLPSRWGELPTAVRLNRLFDAYRPESAPGAASMKPRNLSGQSKSPEVK